MAKKRATDPVLFFTVLLLLISGLVMVYSASAPRAEERVVSGIFVRQAIAAGVGFAAMLAVMHIDYRVLRKPAVIYSLVGGVLVLLTAVLFFPALNGSSRWLTLGPLSIQPSELAKLAVVPYVAYQIDRKGEQVNRSELLLPVLFVVGLIAALVMLEPDLGTTVMVIAVAGLMLFLAGLSWRWLLLGGATGAAALTLLVTLSDYRHQRWLDFLDPTREPQGGGYQALQSLIAVGSGGVFGRGPGESVQKLAYLPQPESDFIFSIVAEELGMIGALALLTAFGVLLWRGIAAALAAPDPFGRHLALGLTCLVVVQALINVGVALAVLPTTGITLPFISAGGTSLVVTLTACGILLNVSEHG